jgi:rhodanese-related sulfurtransferase
MITLTQKSISPRELHLLLLEGSAPEILDVRTPVEYAAEHIPGARLVPLDELDVSAFLKQRGPSNKPLYVLCQSGGRAGRAIGMFRRAGFDSCMLVDGGMQAWIDGGLPLTRGESKVLPLMRQVQLTVGLVSAIGAALAITVNPLFALVPLVTGFGLFFAGLTGFCGLALVLAKMPWNNKTEGKANSNSCCSSK